MNRFSKTMITLVAVGTLIVPTAAADISVQLDGNIVHFADAKPEITSSRTMVPFRAMAEAMGYTVGWDDGRVTAENNGRTISFLIGDNQLLIRDTPDSDWKTLEMDVSPYINLDRTYVPVRFFGEAFDQEVKWDDESKTAVIYDRNKISERIDAAFGLMNGVNEKLNSAVGSQIAVDFTYKLPNADGNLVDCAYMFANSIRSGDKTLTEMTLDLSGILAMMNESETESSDEIDPGFTYGNELLALLGSGEITLDVISDPNEGIFVSSSLLDQYFYALLESESEGMGVSMEGINIWLKFTKDALMSEENTSISQLLASTGSNSVSEMLLASSENAVATEIVSRINEAYDKYSCFADDKFVKTDNGWSIDHSDESGLTVIGSISDDLSSLELFFAKVSELDQSELCFAIDAMAVDQAIEIVPDGLVIDMSEYLNATEG